ncbi:MAG: DUF554 domain-containing protein [Clostridia bacterium]|nr:DUF554 domain-containing protein [Clostridia bacterium]
MTGTLINVATVLLGTAIGLLLRKGIPERMRDTVMQGQGLCVVLIGLTGAFQTTSAIGVIICMVVGSLLGAWIDIERRLGDLGASIENRVSGSKADGSLAKGFVSASLLFCVGSMAIVGSLEDGLSGDATTLIAKSVLDGVSAIFFASSMGVGVGLSAVAVLLYQGAITLMASWVGPFLSDAVINEMSAVGGLLIAGIGLNMIYDQKRIPVGNMLPAIFMPILYVPYLAPLMP